MRNKSLIREKVPKKVKIEVLTEAGYRCAVPTCRSILAIDMHHIIEVVEGGGNELANLIALCPTCHALFHRGVISRDSIYSWKSMLTSLSQAFDTETIDNLLFLDNPRTKALRVSGDGVLKFSSLVAANLAEFRLVMQNGPLLLYAVTLSQKGQMLVDAWKRGDQEAVTNALAASHTIVAN